jgi:hypothetical protein
MEGYEMIVGGQHMLRPAPENANQPEILGLEINWHKGFANDPTIKLLVDRAPTLEEFRYKTRPVGRDYTLFYGTYGPWVDFAAHTPSNESGYGGRKFTYRLEDETEMTVKGPWSSRSSYMNMYFEHCIEVTLYERDWKNLGMSCSIQVYKLNDYLEYWNEDREAELQIDLLKLERLPDGEIMYVPHPRKGCTADWKGEKRPDGKPVGGFECDFCTPHDPNKRRIE